MIMKIIVCFFAGMGAGLGTGFAGMSAAVVISPMLITLLGSNAYEAVGIALASDVLASAVSAYTYGKNRNLDIKNGILMMTFVLLFTLIGSYASSFVPNTTMGGFSMFMTLLMGIKFLVKPINNPTVGNEENPNKRRIKTILMGSIVGFICGFIGAGGGIMMLFVLTSILSYDLKTAVGTSVFIMTFTAFTGAFSHFMIGGLTEYECLFFCILFTLLWARIAAKLANRSTPERLNRMTGGVLVILGILMIFIPLIQ